MKKINVITVSIAMLFMVNISYSQKSIILKYNLQENTQYNYTTESKQKINMEVNGSEMEMVIDLYFDMLYKIVDKTSDQNKIEGEISRIKLTQSMFGMDIDYDSETASSNNPMLEQMNEEFQKILNKPYYMTMSHEGEINNLDLSNINENNDLTNNFNSGTSFANYPNHSIKVGESWSADITPTTESDMKYAVTYTLTKVENNQATISVDGIISTNDAEDVSLNIEGTINGEMIVDIKSGWLIESLLNQYLKMDIEQDGTTFPATTTGTIKNTSSKI